MKVLNAINGNLLHRFATNRLNDVEKKQVTTLLQRFVRGELDESESNELIDVLAKNDRCMAFLDQLWVRQPVEPAFAATPALDGATAVRLQNKLFDRVHRSHMTGAVFKMGTQGFLEVAVCLLRPFTRRTTKLQPRRKRNQP